VLSSGGTSGVRVFVPAALLERGVFRSWTILAALAVLLVAVAVRRIVATSPQGEAEAKNRRPESPGRDVPGHAAAPTASLRPPAKAVGTVACHPWC
jgi:hypothetical protein